MSLESYQQERADQIAELATQERYSECIQVATEGLFGKFPSESSYRRFFETARDFRLWKQRARKKWREAVLATNFIQSDKSFLIKEFFYAANIELQVPKPDQRGGRR